MECVSLMFLVTIRSDVLSLNFKITVLSTCCKFWKDVSKFLVLLAKVTPGSLVSLHGSVSS